MKQSEVEAYRKKVLGPAIVAAKRMFGSPDGKVVLEALDRIFTSNLVARDEVGRVDPEATLIRVGNKEVIDYLRALAEYTEGDRE